MIAIILLSIEGHWYIIFSFVMSSGFVWVYYPHKLHWGEFSYFQEKFIYDCYCFFLIVWYRMFPGAGGWGLAAELLEKEWWAQGWSSLKLWGHWKHQGAEGEGDLGKSFPCSHSTWAVTLCLQKLWAPYPHLRGFANSAFSSAWLNAVFRGVFCCTQAFSGLSFRKLRSQVKQRRG